MSYRERERERWYTNEQRKERHERKKECREKKKKEKKKWEMKSWAKLRACLDWVF